MKKWREGLGLSQAGLASRLGVARETVNRWERNKLRIPRWMDMLYYFNPFLDPDPPRPGPGRIVKK